MSISLEWQKAMTVVARAEAVLSFLGSGWICQHVLLSPGKRGRVYHRMLLGMSFGELLRAIVRFSLQWWVPAEEYGWWGARGTRFTCVMQGFLLQLCLVSIFYNAGLSLCCLFTIRYGWSERKTAGHLEPWIHGLTWALGLGMAIAGISLKLYNSFGFVCYIGPWPPGCTQSWKSTDGKGTCERGDNATLYTIFFYELWFGLAFLCTVVSMFLVYWRLRHLENRIQRYDFARQTTMQPQQQQMSRMGSFFPGQSSGQTLPLSRNNSHRFAMQALLYSLVYFVCYLVPTIWSLHNNITGGSMFWLLVFSAVIVPLEGFLNFLVYIRPTYVRLRKQRADLKPWRVLNEIVCGNSTVLVRPSPGRQTYPRTDVQNGGQRTEVLDPQRAEQNPENTDDLSPTQNHASATVPEGTAKEQEQEIDVMEHMAEEEEEGKEEEHLDEY